MGPFLADHLSALAENKPKQSRGIYLHQKFSSLYHGYWTKVGTQMEKRMCVFLAWYKWHLRCCYIQLHQSLILIHPLFCKDDIGCFIALKVTTATNEEFIVCNVYAATRNKVQEQMKYINYVKETFSQLDSIHFNIGGILMPFFTLN